MDMLARIFPKHGDSRPSKAYTFFHSAGMISGGFGSLLYVSIWRQFIELPVSTRKGTSWPPIFPLIWKYGALGGIVAGLLVVIPLHIGSVLSEDQTPA